MTISTFGLLYPDEISYAISASKRSFHSYLSRLLTHFFRVLRLSRPAMSNLRAERSKKEKTNVSDGLTRDQLAELLNEDLSREYQAIIAYVIYSQVLKGAEYMNIADELVKHAHQELEHALIISPADRLSWQDADRDTLSQ